MIYNPAAAAYAKAIRDLKKNNKPEQETKRPSGLLGRGMQRKPKQQETKEKQPYDSVLEAMQEIRKYRSKI